MSDANTRNGSTFLPKGFREFFKSRLNEIFGLTIIIFITSIIVSFWSFDPSDPIYYFKSSTKETVNILGNYGSNISGILLHLFGGGSIFVCIFGYFWGFKFLRNEYINKKRIRIILLIPSIILLSLFLSIFPQKAVILPEGMGGAVGHLISLFIPKLYDGWAFGYLPGGNWPFLILALFISLPIFLWSCTASKREIGFLKFIILPIIKFINYLISFFNYHVFDIIIL